MATRAELTEMRLAVMERIDRLQHMVTEIRDDIAVNLGAADAMQRANDNTRELVRLQGDRMNIMWRQPKNLAAKAREITGDPGATNPTTRCWPIAQDLDRCPRTCATSRAGWLRATSGGPI